MENEAAETADSGVLQGAAMLMRLAGGSWNVPSTDSWKDERSLQDIVGDNPTILPGVTDPAAATVLEFQIYGTGRVDVLCVEADGTLTVCEVKLRRNPDIRRQVLGQVLAYAAGLTAMSYAEVDREWHARKGNSLAGCVLGSDADPADVAVFQAAVTDRLRGGKFRLVLAVDELTDELRSVIDYLAQHTDADVDLVALEVAYARHGEVEVLVPRAWGSGSTVKRSARQRSRADGTRVPLEDADEIIAASEKALLGAGRIVQKLLNDLSARLSYLYVGDTDRLSDIGCVVVADDPVRCQPLAIRPGLKVPGVRICFDWMRGLGLDRLDTLLANLESAPALAPLLADVREAGYRKRPLVPFEVLRDPAVLDLVVSELLVALRPLAPSEDVTPVKPGMFDKDRLHALMAAIPRGRWTTYGELADLAGTGGQALGSHIKSCAVCPNAARVLPSGGQPSPGFIRTDRSDRRTQREELESEGVTFANDVADPARKISASEVERLAHELHG